MLKVFSNPAPWTIAAMFIVSGGLVRTGLINSLRPLRVAPRGAEQGAGAVAGRARSWRSRSAFTNNTPLVAVMIPVTVQIAHAMGLAPSKLLIPLSYQTVLGGMISMIGTSTNMLVDGVARAQGMAPFRCSRSRRSASRSRWSGFVTMWLLVPRFLPNRDFDGGPARPAQADEVLHRGGGAGGLAADRLSG